MDDMGAIDRYYFALVEYNKYSRFLLYTPIADGLNLYLNACYLYAGGEREKPQLLDYIENYVKNYELTKL